MKKIFSKIKNKSKYALIISGFSVFLIIPVAAHADYEVGFDPGYDISFDPGYNVGFDPGYDVGFTPAGYDYSYYEPIYFYPAYYGYYDSIGFYPGTSDIHLDRVRFYPGESNVVIPAIGFATGTSDIVLPPIGFASGTSNIFLPPISFIPGSSGVFLPPIGFAPGSSYAYVPPVTGGVAGASVAYAAVPATGITDDPRIILFLTSLLGLSAVLTFMILKLLRKRKETSDVKNLPKDTPIFLRQQLEGQR